MTSGERITENNVSTKKDSGFLTVALDKNGIDTYKYDTRAARVRWAKDQMIMDDLEPLPSPHTLEIEPTLLCNANCHFCSYEADIATYRDEIASGITKPFEKDDAIQLLDAIKRAGTTSGIFWSGGGEPLLWPPIIDAIKYSAEFADVALQTNGARLHKINEDGCLGSIKLLAISVYADNADLHRSIAGVNSFDRVIQNIKESIKIKDKLGLGTCITAKILVDRYNYSRLPQIVSFYRSLGVDSIGIREVQDYNYGGDGKRLESVELTDQQRDILAKIIVESGADDPVLLSFLQAMKSKGSRPAITDHCYNAIDGHFACIDARGFVYLGNPEIGQQDMSIGNILETPWQNIWKSPRHYEVISKMEDMQLLGACANGLCRHVRSNIGVQRFISGSMDKQDIFTTNDDLQAFL
jgi:MoaA/NifB/PqqE/SkfB family radical SAM enzyme